MLPMLGQPAFQLTVSIPRHQRQEHQELRRLADLRSEHGLVKWIQDSNGAGSARLLALADAACRSESNSQHPFAPADGVQFDPSRERLSMHRVASPRYGQSS